MLRANLHLLLHAIVPALYALAFHRRRFARAWLILVATMVIDLDHLLSDPVYDPTRCSIGTHPLHTVPAMGVYAIALLSARLRLVAVGLLIHLCLDGIDCVWMSIEK